MKYYNNLDIRKYKMYNQNIQDIEPWELQDFTDFLIKSYNKYLVFAFNCTWNNKSGYTLKNDIIECLQRSYECGQYLESITPKNKAILLNEISHDKPFGYDVVIIGLTDAEAERLEASDFQGVEKFAKKYLDDLIYYKYI